MRSSLTTHVRLEALDEQELLKLLCVHLRVTVIQPEVLAHVCRRTAGNALYCLEIANAMVERKILKIADGVCTLSPDVEDLESVGLPNSLHGAISAQLDRMPPYCVAIVKAASVVGMQFPSRILYEKFQLEGTRDPEDRRKTMLQLTEMKMVEPTSESNYWSQLLDDSRGTRRNELRVAMRLDGLE